ncbi:hypothetical protein FH603_5710 [Spirosoma sp. LMG 31447]|uniref:Uncharacterized protein n=1 Tax=Spirosoma utsteinense TaxID=2585773 RepID=A0ABR6WGJ0_9BACT|nr:hypothetical protein [Spirosoma utsteinense]
MGRIPTFRSNFNDLRKLTLANLKQLGYVVSRSRCSGSVRWTRNGETIGTISVTVDLLWDNCVELEYTYNSEEQMKYKIELVQLPSNLGKGNVWYFVCPLTGKRCRTLYQVGRYFVSRKALQGALYESQTYSKQYRQIARVCGPYYKLREALEKLDKPYAKMFYRGKPTPIARRVFKWQRLNGIYNSGGTLRIDKYL